jgi:hypothetical protein
MCRECENSYEPPRGEPDTQTRLARQLRGQGFRLTRRFAAQFVRRLPGDRPFHPYRFRRAFFEARRFRPARPGLPWRVALVRGLPIVYRRDAGQIILLGLLPAEARSQLIPLVRPGAGEGEQHGSRYRSARQVFLRGLSTNPNIPRFIRGWSKQEQRRQQVAGQQRAKGFRAAGVAQTAARQARLQAVAADTTQSPAARQWAADQLRRLARGQGRLRALQVGHTPRRTNLRGVPGYDVGHPIGYIRGTRTPLKSLQDPRTFRPEMATQNRGRPGIARRLGLDPRAYAESDPLLLEIGDPWF